MQLSFILEAIKTRYHGSDLALKQTIEGFSTDTRSLCPGDLFIAIVGTKVDGHNYIKEAEAKGALAVLVSKAVETALPQFVVNDTIIALGQLGKAHRMQFDIPMVALTGSSGKTTVKEMIASILSLRGPILATAGNLNTDIGVPLTLLRLNETHKHAVIEMGARQQGDISYLMKLAHPTVSLITNAGVAHVEIFGNALNIAKAKGEIFENLNVKGTAVINQDDKNAQYWKSLLKGQSKITFGLHQDADIRCKDTILNAFTTHFTLETDIGNIPIELSVPGEHNIYNALAAAAVARAMDIGLSDIAQGLKQFVAVSGRLQFKASYTGCKIIDDTYNANPASMEAAMRVLSKCPGQKIVVMGDMFELGLAATSLHKAIGEKARELKIDKLYGVGELTKSAVLGFGENAKHFDTKSNLVAELIPHIDASTTILVKGSRGMRMEDVVLALTDTRKTQLC